MILPYIDERLNLKMLLVQLHYISHDYKAFGKQAGLSADVLSELDKFTSKPFDGLMKVCSLWFRRLKDENVKPTWEAVAEILFKMGLEKLALEILQGYTTGMGLPSSWYSTSCTLKSAKLRLLFTATFKTH